MIMFDPMLIERGIYLFAAYAVVLSALLIFDLLIRVQLYRRCRVLKDSR